MVVVRRDAWKGEMLNIMDHELHRHSEIGRVI